MKRLITILLLMFMITTSWAQTAVSAAEQKQMISQINSAAKAIKTLQCDFTQVKHISLLGNDMTSQGRMYFKGGNKLRWEYSKPYSYTFIINGGKVQMKRSNSQTSTIDVNSSRLFQEITRIMMLSVTGECLSNASDFKVKMYKSKNEWEARITPVKKEMAKMFSSIILHFDAQQKMVTCVEMKEKSGDTTVIRMTNAKKNQNIADNMFVI